MRARCRAARDNPGGSAASSHGWSVEALKNKIIPSDSGAESGKWKGKFNFLLFLFFSSEK